jgi:hypothetical protein
MRIHVMEAVGLNTYRIVVHSPTPGGNNSAGIAWSTAIQNSGRNQTSMTVGNGAGQISSSESNQVASGSVVEAQFNFTDDPNWSTAERNAALNTQATQLVAELQAELSKALKFFGATVA